MGNRSTCVVIASSVAVIRRALTICQPFCRRLRQCLSESNSCSVWIVETQKGRIVNIFHRCKLYDPNWWHEKLVCWAQRCSNDINSWHRCLWDTIDLKRASVKYFCRNLSLPSLNRWRSLVWMSRGMLSMMNCSCPFIDDPSRSFTRIEQKQFFLSFFSSCSWREITFKDDVDMGRDVDFSL